MSALWCKAAGGELADINGMKDYMRLKTEIRYLEEKEREEELKQFTE